jgi:ubiquinone/menaquinone biosynthesis C-methylase UbiE
MSSGDISGRFWNLPQKGGEEAAREQNFIDDIISKAHIERLLLENLHGVRTAFDGGGGAGRFSIPLAARGVRVTHFDISQPMIDKARQLAERRGAAQNITFVKGALEDLSAFEDNQFDLVMSFDAPVSYTWPEHERVLAELVRIAAKRVCISVYSRAATVAYRFDPAQKEKYFLDPRSNDPMVRWFRRIGKRRRGFRPDFAAAREVLRTGLPDDPQDIAAAFERGETPWPMSYAFTPGELQALLERFGAREVKLSGPGALARSIPGELLREYMRDEALKQEFLDFCYEYDSQPWAAGLGKDNVAAMAEVSCLKSNV